MIRAGDKTNTHDHYALSSGRPDRNTHILPITPIPKRGGIVCSGTLWYALGKSVQNYTNRYPVSVI